jgi:hypothetical protein
VCHKFIWYFVDYQVLCVTIKKPKERKKITMRAYTADEIRKEFLNSIQGYIWYCEELKDKTTKQKLELLAFSILNIIDGTSANFPASLDLVVRVAPEDKDYHIDIEENWYEDGTVINESTYLHDCWQK